jgi:HlyD family secretion protein
VKRKSKITLGVVGVLVLATAALIGVRMSKGSVVTVQTGRAFRQDLTSIVTASGEIKPRNYINIGANAQGRITAILVKEGDRVRKDQVVARIEAVQAQAEVQAQQAAVNSALADSSASEAAMAAMDDAIRTAQAGVDRSKADMERTRLNYERAENLYKDKLIARQEYDQRRAEFDSAAAAVRESEARLAQSRTQLTQSRAQLEATQRRVAQIPRRRRPGQTQRGGPARRHGDQPADPRGRDRGHGDSELPGSLIMTIADMSLITAEVKVDETDIVNVQLDQPVDVTIDAIPGRRSAGTSSRSATRRSCAPPVLPPPRARSRARRRRTSKLCRAGRSARIRASGSFLHLQNHHRQREKFDAVTAPLQA